jgi:hypothetical protein
MARKFLTSIDLNHNELIKAVVHNLATDPVTGVAGQLYYNTNSDVLKIYSGSASAWVAVGSEEYIGDSVANLLNSGDGISLSYDDNGNSLIIANTGVLSLTGTEEEVLVSASAGNITLSLPETINADTSGNAATATALETARTISLSGDVSGSVSFNGTEDVDITVNIGSDSSVASITGTENQIEVSASVGNVVIGLPDDVTIGGSLTITGDLIVSGSATTLNTETLLVEDNLVVLNSNVVGSPTIDAGIEVERGDENNASFFWDESEGKWTANDGTTSTAVSLEGHTHSASAITDFNTAVDTEIDAYLNGSDSISISSGTIDTIINGAASVSFLTNVGGLAVAKSELETALIADTFTRKYIQTIGNNSSTSFTLSHNLNTRDVTVQVYDIATYETVEVDVVRTNTSSATVSFNVAPATDSYRVVVIG